MKKFFVTLLCLLMIFCFMPTMAWADTNTDTAPKSGTTLPAANSEGVIVLDGNYEVDTLSPTGTYDLQGHTLTVRATGSIKIEAGQTLTVYDSTATGSERKGTLIFTAKSGGYTKADIAPEAGGIATVKNITVQTPNSAFYPRGTATAVNVLYCDVTAGCYCVGTNAAEAANGGIRITLTGSTLTANGGNGDNCPVMINVAGTLEIEDCVITGGRQGVLVRAGEATIDSSTIKTTCTFNDPDKYVSGNWGSGNEVPVAGLVVGNDSKNAGSYTANAVLHLTNSKVTSEKEEASALHVDGNSQYKAELTITGADTEIGKIHRANTDNGQAAITITGGKFTQDVNAYVPEGLKATDESGSWSIGLDPDKSDAIAVAEDFNILSGETKGYSVGWKYGADFNTDLITKIEVYLTDDSGARVLTYTAEDKQLDFQRHNTAGYVYINENKQSSAPFVNTVEEGDQDDWFVTKGPAFAGFAATKAYIVITVGDAELTLTKDCTHQHTWATDFTVDQAATTAAAGEKSKHCTDADCIARSEITAIPKISSGGGGGYYPPAPTVQKPMITQTEGVTVALSADGKTATITVASGYVLTDVTVNGVSMGRITTLTDLKTGDKVMVTAEKTEAPAPPDDTAQIEAVKQMQLVARSAMSRAKGKKAVKITWKVEGDAVIDLDGVEIFRSVKRYSGFGKKPIFSTTKAQYYNTAIKVGTKYYYKVRGYKVIGGEKVYTGWSTKAWRTVK